MKIEFRHPNRDDIHQVVKIHKEFFKEGLISSFPDELVFRIYNDIANSDNSFCFVAIDDKKVVGYISGAISFNKLLKTFILKNIFSMIPYLLTRIFDKKFLDRCLKILKHSQDKIEDIGIEAELLSVAVLTPYQGQGIAKNLFNYLCEYFHKVNIKQFKILVGSELSESIKFYQKVGAVKIMENQWHNDKCACIFIKDIS